jgi:protein TonB
MALRQGIEGVVYLELYIDKFGNIKKMVVLKDPGYGFSEAAVKALQGVKFLPAIYDGNPVATKIRYPFRFILQK